MAKEINFQCTCGGQIKPCLIRTDNHNPHSIFQCDTCQKFIQPFLDLGDTPAKIHDITCASCRQHGCINGVEPAVGDESIKNLTLDTDDEQNGEFTFVVCVHCHCLMEYNIHVPCGVLYPVEKATHP